MDFHTFVLMKSPLDRFFEECQYWNKEANALREILLSSDLAEESKWNQPCYTYMGNNICIIAVTKGYLALSFFKGVLIPDEENLLVPPGSQTQSARVMNLDTVEAINARKPFILKYIAAAIEIELAGAVVDFKKGNQIEICAELLAEFQRDPILEDAFYTLTPGRQRGYHIHFASGKKSSTRVNRIQKYKDRIIKGYGINDCTCGQSKRMPNCDGSHKSSAV